MGLESILYLDLLAIAVPSGRAASPRRRNESVGPHDIRRCMVDAVGECAITRQDPRKGRELPPRYSLPVSDLQLLKHHGERGCRSPVSLTNAWAWLARGMARYRKVPHRLSCNPGLRGYKPTWHGRPQRNERKIWDEHVNSNSSELLEYTLRLGPKNTPGCERKSLLLVLGIMRERSLAGVRSRAII